MTTNSLAVGIDLGTTHCALAYASLDDEKHLPTPLPIPQVVHAGEYQSRPLLPSFIYLPAKAELRPGALSLPWNDGFDFAVGHFARERGATTPARVVASAKSWLSHSGVDRRADILPWRAPAEIPHLSPLEATTRFLQHLRSAWDDSHPESPLVDQDVVLTVPASFDAIARDLTVEAARRAGLQDKLRLLEEPQAALYAWVADRGAQWRKELAVGEVILVCDIGGGTTDFSLIAVGEFHGRRATEADSKHSSTVPKSRPTEPGGPGNNSEFDGSMELERVAVGDHILLGGDNMDLALAYAVRARLQDQGTKIDDWQMRALTHSCRVAKEVMFADGDRQSHPLTIA
ncbi:MAG: Hsp70 family protein, partial [Proteobacteria bacterium]|nr:Hsp70 family protein [Pseudomonadota bacterium]